MFEEYLQDASEFFRLAAENSDVRIARRYYRAAVFYTASAMEAFVNYVADTFEKGGTFTPHEIAFLTDKNLAFSQKRWIVEEKTEFHRVEDKIRFLLHKFSPEFDFNNQAWSSLMNLKDVRDSLIHPRVAEDETTIEAYRRILGTGLHGVISTMNSISEAIFKKPLRPQILDLRPEK